MTNGQFSCFIIETNFCLHICIYTGIYVFCVSVGMKANTGDLCCTCESMTAENFNVYNTVASPVKKLNFRVVYCYISSWPHPSTWHDILTWNATYVAYKLHSNWYCGIQWTEWSWL